MDAPSPAKRPADETSDNEGESPKRQKIVDDEAAESTALTTSNPDGKRVVKKVVKKKKRPAPPQVDPSTFKTEPPPQTGTIFNIWYNKWSGGDREDKYLSKTKALSRCNIAKHSGYTKADGVPGSYFCLFFARGICPRGRDCEYLHRLPSTFDIYSGNVDCFGREKHSDYRDDMGGVGSFMRQNRTLYVGRIHPTDDVEEIVARHFAEWGKIERTRVLPTRGVAFVTYTTEALAQFAKEAMAHQSLDNDEILNVRWATVDPNPAAQKREAKKVEEQAAEAIRRALPEVFVREIEGRDPDARKRRREEGKFGLDGYEASDEVWFQSEKAKQQLEAAPRTAALGAADQTLMIEGQNGAENTALNESYGGGGLLSASTLAALNGFAPENSGAKFESKAPSMGLGGALVDYDSDDDDD